MEKVGLVAGSGILPLEFVWSAKKLGEKVVVFALKDMASPELEKAADRVYWLGVGEQKKLVFLLLKERIRKLSLLGKVDKNNVYKMKDEDPESKKILNDLRDNKDYSILAEITRRLKLIGVEVVDNMRYLSHLIPEKGILGLTAPDKRVEEDLKFGYDIAKKLAGMDIGQTVVVKGRAIVAVEAMEGTDEVIARAGRVAGKGCVMVKVSRPDQDFRWDVPTVGPATLEKLAEHSFAAIGLESRSMYIIEKEKMVRFADDKGISVIAI